MKYLNTKQISEIWGISERSVRLYCEQGRISDAYFNNGKWHIPEDAKKPIRIKRNKKRNITNVLIDQKNNKISGSIYNKLQVDFAYNSNHIEGSMLTHEETQYIFDTKTISGDNININDILETINHFRCFDYIIDTYNKQLNEKYIKHIHKLLKQNTISADSMEAVVGEYKRYENIIGDIKTTPPSQVSNKMKKLLSKYNNDKKHSIEDLIEFHVEFERIHPFYDGNGRVGRLLLFKECLKENIVPFIIDDKYKREYYNGLQKWQINKEKNYLLETCLLMQDNMKIVFDFFNIVYK